MPVQGAAQGADRAAHLMIFSLLPLHFLAVNFLVPSFVFIVFSLCLSVSLSLFLCFTYLLGAAIFEFLALPRGGLAPEEAERPPPFIFEKVAAAA